jgi:hypothetical protein
MTQSQLHFVPTGTYLSNRQTTKLLLFLNEKLLKIAVQQEYCSLPFGLKVSSNIWHMTV